MNGPGVNVETMSEEGAARLTSESKHGYVWPVGLYIIVDNERSVLESREEAEALIAAIQRAADELWPCKDT